MASLHHFRRGAGNAIAVAALTALVAALPTNQACAQSTDDPVMRANRGAYEAAIKCFIANGHASGLRERAGDPEKAKYYDAKAHLSFDTATKLGAALQLSGSQIDEDFGTAQARELPTMVTDQKYFGVIVANCKALGLM